MAKESSDSPKFANPESRGNSKSSNRRGLRWIRLAVIAVLVAPIFFIFPLLSERESVRFTKIEVSNAAIFHEAKLFCEITNTGDAKILLQGTTAIAEQKDSKRIWILSDRRRQVTLGPKQSIRVLYHIEELRGAGKFRIRLSRFREPSTWDNILHWLSRHFPGQEHRRKLREKIGPNSTNIYSDWIEAPATKTQ